MKKFKLHFFKEKVRTLDFEKILSFFDDYPEATLLPTKADDLEVKILYHLPIINLKAYFVLSKKSNVAEIYKLSPQYLDVNFRFEISLLTPNFSAKLVFEVVEKLIKTFELFCFNYLLEDVMEYKREVILRSFEIAKQNFKDKHQYELTDYYYFPESKLNDCLKYLYEQYDLYRFYKEQEVIVPNYLIIKDENERIYFAIDWKENTKTVFPPHLSYIFYTFGNEKRILPFEEVMAKLERFTVSVPGFIENTKVIAVKKIKRVHKIVKKIKVTPINYKFKQVLLKQLIDINKS